ncbi:MAG: LLM class flavin-dependent oxidoreductase [Candidatus Bathyarchaeota archaeon]|nr:MAG: LLM class flavin-dependent oxidoreductase [Candidatus Bathyarchaeota archaeon]
MTGIKTSMFGDEMLESEGIRFGAQVQAGPFSKIVEQCVLCEKLGFDSVWYPDHMVGGNPSIQWPELFTTLTTMGINTSKVTVASLATDPLKRHPSVIAQSLATIDGIVGGRTALGIGAGEAMNLAPYGIPISNLYGKLREAIQVIKLLWTASHENPAKFEGSFFSLSDAFLQIKPIRKPHPPIYVGAFGPRMLEMTGELGDGWIPFSHTPETYRKCLNGSIKKGAEKAGRTLSDIEPAFLAATSISNDREQARKGIERAAKRFLVLLPRVLQMVAPQIKHPGDAYALAYWMGRLKAEDMKVISDIAEQIPTDIALRTVFWGTPDDCVEQVESFIKAGCRHIIFGLRGKDPGAAIRLLSEVVSYFGERKL